MSQEQQDQQKGQKIGRERLIAELERLGEIVDGQPTLSDLREYGDYSRQPYVREFGSWSNALQAAGYGRGQTSRIPRSELIAEVQRLADELGKTPTRDEMNEHGEYSRSPYDHEFGSWNDALDAAGFNPNKRNNIPQRELTAELKRLADELGRTPTIEDMRERGEFSDRTYKRLFGSWNEALSAVSLDVNKPHDVKESLICEWCGDDYEVRPSRSAKSRYCSNECKDAAKTEWVGEKNPHPNAGERVTIACEWCGESVVVYPSQAANARFCSYDCLGKHNADVRSGPESPRWRGGYDGYYGPMWPEQREKALERDGYECTICEATEDLVVHHKTPFREFVGPDGRDYEAAHRLDNLLTLCRVCHTKIENPHPNG